MNQYKLFVESHQVTLVDQETGRRESWGITGPADLRVAEAVFQCRKAGFTVTLEAFYKS